MAQGGPFENLDPKRPFRFTGEPYEADSIEITIVHGPLLADTSHFRLFCDLLRSVRAATTKARGAHSKDEQLDAIQQLTVLTAAVIGVEAQALLSLVTTGSSVSARIHLRTMGEATRRIRIFMSDPEFALKVFRSYVASQHKLAMQLLSEEHEIAKRLRELLDAAEKKTDRALTRDLFDRDTGAADISKGEADAWSKWSHAEITALAEIARRAEQNKNLPFDQVAADDTQGKFYLFRGAVFLWLVLLALIVIGIEAEEDAKRYKTALQELGRSEGWVEAALDRNRSG